jgi:hypothetical protein
MGRLFHFGNLFRLPIPRNDSELFSKTAAGMRFALLMGGAPMGGTAMSLPGVNEKRFLEIEDCDGGFFITVEPPQAEELLALFVQHGIPCRKEVAGPGKLKLVFDSPAEREAAAEVLDGYTQAKGS